MNSIACLPAAAVAAVVFTALVTFPVHAQDANTESLSDCASEQGVTYLCGFVVPEDVVNVGSTGLVLASGHRAPGHMYLIDPESGESTELIHNDNFRQLHDTRAWPDCPGPVNLESFDVHGISLAETSPGRFSIYTTSHGEREAIEIYNLDMLGAATALLTWTGCVPLQEDGYFNAVARLPDGGFVTTRMIDKNADRRSAPGRITGRVLEWHPGGELQPLAGTELSLPNGIEVSPDGRYLFVAASGTEELVRFDRRTTPMEKNAVATPMGPDNIHWDERGTLLIAGPYASDRVCDAPRCTDGWAAIEVDPDTLAISILGGVDESAAMQYASAAIRVGNEIWVGSNQDRIARFPLR